MSIKSKNWPVHIFFFAKDVIFAYDDFSLRQNNAEDKKSTKRKIALDEKIKTRGADFSLDHTGRRGRHKNQNDNDWKFKSYKGIKGE